MVYRIFVERRPGFRREAEQLAMELRRDLGIKGLESLRLINRYDVEGVDEQVFARAVRTVFSEPQTDETDDILTLPRDAAVVAVEALPGQFDQRADSAAQCIQLMTAGEKPTVSFARLYVLEGRLSGEDMAAVKRHVINPVESREASMRLPDTLRMPMPEPESIPSIDGFCGMDGEALARLLDQMSLAMDRDDILFVQEHFRTLRRDPTMTELRVMDTYWSDHCRHTTFLTELENVDIADETIRLSYEAYLDIREKLGIAKAPTLMSVATIAAKHLKQQGLLPHLDESEEINACTVRIKADTPGGEEDWLLLFKNETHNHPTEIEPFGGAATCIGGAIRDPLSARSYVYAAMRVTGAGDPTAPLRDTLPGKLPQRKICAGAWAGFSSYGNQIGLATGQVHEMYHPGYTAKRLETGAVLGAAPLSHVRRERPAAGDIVILLGGRTGRDGIGGATGSSRAHTEESVDTCASQVQKGNAPEERKLQRLFLNKAATTLIKRCNDFGAGGVSVAVGELADGLLIDLDKVPRKYAGLDGTELAISESQERMAVVVAPGDADAFYRLAEQENLEATAVAVVTAEPRMVMRWRGQKVVDLDRAFLSSNGAKKRQSVRVRAPENWQYRSEKPFFDELTAFVSSLAGCSRQGLSERFDSTIGAGTVLMPFGGCCQMTPPCAMVHTLPVDGGTATASYMAFGCLPTVSEKSPYHGAHMAVVDSVAKLVAAGAPFENVYLSFQEFFPRPGKEPERWGMVLSSLLGALRAQEELGVAAIGGKDSMSGTFEKMDVPPTFISFAVTWDRAEHAVSPEFKGAGHRVLWLKPAYGRDGLPTPDSLKALFARITRLLRSGRAVSVSVVGEGGAAYQVFLSGLGNGIGFTFARTAKKDSLFEYAAGSFLVEIADDQPIEGELLGYTEERPVLAFGDTCCPLSALQAGYENKLERVYPMRALASEAPVAAYSYEGGLARGRHIARPRVLIPAFPGTNCELDTARAFERAGAKPEVLVIRNLTPGDVATSAERMERAIREAQIIMLPGGFSGGDEPDGSGKLITALFRNPGVRDAVEDLLSHRDGLMGGICNGFQALIKLGLVPFGHIVDMDENSPTLTYNLIGRHQSRMVRVRTASTLSPWFSGQKVGEIRSIPISHGEGRFVCPPSVLEKLAEKGQIASQYVDDAGMPSMDVAFNPAGSLAAVEGITSPDGRVFGRMGHAERMLPHLYRNMPGAAEDPMFQSAVAYYL